MGDGGMEEELRGCAALLLNIAAFFFFLFFSYENFMKVLLYRPHSALSCFHSSSCESWEVYRGTAVGSVSLRDPHLLVTNDSPVFTGALGSEILPKGSSFLECCWRLWDQLCSEISKSVTSANCEPELNQSSLI